MAKKFEVSTIFKGIDKMSAPLARIQNRVETFTRRTTKQIRTMTKATDKWVGTIKSAGVAMVAFGALAGATLMKTSQAGINFEQTIVNASAKFGDAAARGTDAFRQLEEAAQRTGATTEFTATQSAEALNFLAMAGFNAEQSISALPGVVDLATAAQVDLATATDIATDTLGAFGLGSKDAAQQAKNLARVNDVLAKTATTSNTTMSQMFEAMKKGGPVATTTGASIETVAAMIGTMANAGIKAEVAGTAVANAFLNLSSPASGAEKVMKRLGIQVQDSTGSLKDMPSIIDEVNKKTAALTKTQRTAAIEAIFGREGLAGTVAVLSQGGDALKEYRARLEDANGSANKMATTMRDTTRGSLNSLNSAIEGVSITLFNTNKGPMREAIDLATQWVRANGDLIAQNIGEFFLTIANNIDAIINAGKGLAAVVATVWGLSFAIKAVSVATTALNAVLAINPFVAMAGVFVALVQLSDDFAKNLREMPQLVQNAFNRSMLGSLAQGLQIVKGLPSAFDGGGFLGFGEDSVPAPSSPQERTARTVSETITTSTNEVIIKDETGRAEIQNIRGPQRLTVAQTGGM
ncbi:hypothetical protein [Shewanella phage SFCi1]|nr:hypothetical protein [Shewanella phage SFCi1]